MPFVGFDDHMADAFRYYIHALNKSDNEGRKTNMKNFKVGDKILLRNDLKTMDNYYGTCFVPAMANYKIYPLTITKVLEDGLYEAKGTNDDDTTWFVRDEMIAEEWNEVMTIGRALDCMKLGMKIRATHWDADEYIYYDGDEILGESGEEYHIDGCDLENIWVEYKDEETELREEVKKEKINRLGDYNILVDKDQESLVILLRDMKTAINKLVDAHNGEENV